MPNWDQATLVAYQARRAVSGAQLEPIIHHGAVGAQAGEGAHSGRVPVRITSYRRRLTDIDNLAGKYFLDATIRRNKLNFQSRRSRSKTNAMNARSFK